MRAPVPFVAPSVPVPAAPLIRTDVALSDIDPEVWDALAPDQPLLSHAFLTALHQTGCASRRTGWTPRFITAWRGHALAGALPLYAKSHSYGEYVFDWAWADAYRRYGRRYYPKLVAAIPFTPVPGPRLLAPDAPTRRALLDRALDLVADGQYSSLHVLFLDAEQADEAQARGMIRRTGMQFHWRNQDYRDFTDFLSVLTHDKRKKIKQERRKVAESGLRFLRKSGYDISAADWAFFHRCYEHTYSAHHSTPYLSLEFFQRLGEILPENTLLIVGTIDDQPVCAALDVYTDHTLWGRYWGSNVPLRGAHFEACYYQAIEFCIERGIACFEGGAQGVHKLARGLLPVATHSAHAIGDHAFASAIADYCARERVDIAHSVDELEQSSPFKHVVEASSPQ
ncbi:MAG TPA: GNAT family N-acetyltransferase [Casimicrobiaceae bacterium]|nr:GNAT family N-acetyltransferase [Casimicrobiaceae bacterium]